MFSDMINPSRQSCQSVRVAHLMLEFQNLTYEGSGMMTLKPYKFFSDKNLVKCMLLQCFFLLSFTFLQFFENLLSFSVYTFEITNLLHPFQYSFNIVFSAFR